MTATATATSTGSTGEQTHGTAPLQWTSPEAKLWVATSAGEFAGFVEFGDGHYLVTDGLGAALGTAGTLRDAKRLLEPEAESVPESGAEPASTRLRRRDALLAALATGFGISALSTALVAFGVLHL